MAPAQDTSAVGRGFRPSTGAILARVTCAARISGVALLLGLPPVLELPGAVAVSDKALAFSGVRVLVAFGLLVGAAVSPRLSARARSGVRLVGGAGVAAYAALTIAALFGALDVSIDMAVYLGFIASVLAATAAFACGVSWPRRTAEMSSADEGRAISVPRLAAFALISLGLLELSVGCEPRWTLARTAYTAGGFDAANPWHVLAYSFSGIVGPGPHLLTYGASDLVFRMPLLLLGWLCASAAAAVSDDRKKGAVGMCGLALGVFLARIIASFVPALTEGGVAVGFAAIVAAVALLAADSRVRADRHAKAGVEASPSDDPLPRALDLSSLSPREREAVEGRLAKKSSAEVARQMGVSASTVRNLQARAAKKLGVASLDELCAGESPRPQGLDSSESALGAVSPAPAFALPILTAAACAACVIGVQAGGWTAVALAGEVVLSISLAVVVLAAEERCLASPAVPAAALCGAGNLAGTCVAVTVVAAPIPAACAVCASLVILLAVAELVALRSGFAPANQANPRVSAAVLASFGAGIIAGSALAQPVLTGGELLALAGSMAGVAAVASLASLAFGAIAVFGIVSLAVVTRGFVAYRNLSQVRVQAPSFDERVRALCRLRGLNGTCTDVTVQLLNGANGPQICKSLHIAPGTLNSAKREAYHVFGVHSAAGLITRIVEHLSPNPNV